MKQKNYNNLFLIGFVSLVIFSLVFMGFFNYYRFGGKKITVPEPNINDHILGDLTKAKVVIIEYSDLECPACKFFYQLLKDLKNKYQDDVVLVYRHFPLIEIHPHAFLAAQAAESAGLQGKFWEYHDILFLRQEEWSKSKNPKDLFKKYAKEIGLDVVKFEKDLELKEIIQKIIDQRNEALSLNLPGTPSIFINGNLVKLRSYEDLEKEVEKYLNR